MKITYDPGKRNRTLEERGLDFEDAREVFAGLHFERPAEPRRMVKRGSSRQAISTVGLS